MAIAFRSASSGTYNSTTGSTSLPAGVAAGDLLVLWNIRSANDTAPVTPSGWTLQGSATTASSLTLAVYTRVATGSDSAPTLQWAASGRVSWMISAYTGVNDTTPVDGISIVGYVTGSASSSHTVPSVTATADDCVAIEAVCNKAGAVETNIAAPAGVTRDATYYNPSTSSPNIGIGRADTDTDTGGSGGGHTWTSTVSSQRVLATMLVRPDAGPPPDPDPGTVVHAWPGGMTSTTAKVVSKTNAATSVRLAVSTSSGMTSPTYVSAQTPDGAGRVTHSITGLSANTRYYYQLADTPSGGSESLIGPVGTFRTLQTAGTVVATRTITFGGCVRTGSTTATALTSARSWAPDYGIFNGDLTYAGTGSTSQSAHETAYDNQLSAVTALRELIQDGGAAFYLASDHDTSNIDNADSNDATGAAALAARKAITPMGPGQTTTTERQWDDGRVSFYAIDIRTTDRSAGASTDNSSKTMLGSAQLGRLTTWLSSNTSKFKVIVGDTAWLGTADLVNKTDWWPAYTYERGVLITAINAAQAAGAHVEYWHGDSHLIGYCTAANNPTGNFPVLCAAGFDQDGGGRNTSLFSAFWNNSSGDVNIYARVTFTDDGTTITRTFSGWDAAGGVERVNNSVSVVTEDPGEGSASGTVAFAGSASGVSSRAGSGSGTSTYAGTAQGASTRSGTASGTLAYTGSASGSTARAGTATGTFVLTGAAAGASTRNGVGSGTLAYTGSATGSAPVVGMPTGTAAGTVAYAGTAQGSASKAGTAAGLWSFTSAAAGSRTSSGASSGTWTYLGSAVGSAPVVGGASGTASGSLAFTGLAAGTAPAVGNATGAAVGSWAFVGVARAGEVLPPISRTFPARFGTREFPATFRTGALV